MVANMTPEKSKDLNSIRLDESTMSTPSISAEMYAPEYAEIINIKSSSSPKSKTDRGR
jgi:hypothetical protein